MGEEFHATKPIYMQIVGKISQQIARNELRAGEKLPSVREMAIQTGVNPNTIQRTYSELERMAIVETRRGQGTFVRDDEEMVEQLKIKLQTEMIGNFIHSMNELGLSQEEIIEGVKRFMEKGEPIMIVLDRVSKQYGSEKALYNVTFQLEKGKIYGLLGPNGSGKSTILKMIAGLVLPSEGMVTVNGNKVSRRTAKEVAYLSELDVFYQSFIISEMLSFYQSQWDDFEIEKAQELLQFMDLEPTKKIKKLSKGNRGRLKLVLALSRKASVILLDEPFSGLDPLVRDSIVKGLLSFVDFENQTVVIATHEIEEIEPLLDEVLVLKDGMIADRKNVEELREEYGVSLLQWTKQILK